VLVGNRDDEAIEAVLRQLLAQGIEAGFVVCINMGSS
jgi:hypothetical protein